MSAAYRPYVNPGAGRGAAPRMPYGAAAPRSYQPVAQPVVPQAPAGRGYGQPAGGTVGGYAAQPRPGFQQPPLQPSPPQQQPQPQPYGRPYVPPSGRGNPAGSMSGWAPSSSPPPQQQQGYQTPARPFAKRGAPDGISASMVPPGAPAQSRYGRSFVPASSAPTGLFDSPPPDAGMAGGRPAVGPGSAPARGGFGGRSGKRTKFLRVDPTTPMPALCSGDANADLAAYVAWARPLSVKHCCNVYGWWELINSETGLLNTNALRVKYLEPLAPGLGGTLLILHTPPGADGAEPIALKVLLPIGPVSNWRMTPEGNLYDENPTFRPKSIDSARQDMQVSELSWRPAPDPSVPSARVFTATRPCEVRTTLVTEQDFKDAEALVASLQANAENAADGGVTSATIESVAVDASGQTMMHTLVEQTVISYDTEWEEFLTRFVQPLQRWFHTAVWNTPGAAQALKQEHQSKIAKGMTPANAMAEFVRDNCADVIRTGKRGARSLKMSTQLLRKLWENEQPGPSAVPTPEIAEAHARTGMIYNAVPVARLRQSHEMMDDRHALIDIPFEQLQLTPVMRRDRVATIVKFDSYLEIQGVCGLVARPCTTILVERAPPGVGSAARGGPVAPALQLSGVAAPVDTSSSSSSSATVSPVPVSIVPQAADMMPDEPPSMDDEYVEIAAQYTADLPVLEDGTGAPAE